MLGNNAWHTVVLAVSPPMSEDGGSVSGRALLPYSNNPSQAVDEPWMSPSGRWAWHFGIRSLLGESRAAGREYHAAQARSKLKPGWL